MCEQYTPVLLLMSAAWPCSLPSRVAFRWEVPIHSMPRLKPMSTWLLLLCPLKVTATPSALPCADLVVEVVEDDWSHDQSNTLSNQLHQTHMLGQTYMLDQDGSRIKLAALLQHTTMGFLQQRPHKTRSELPNSTTPTGAQVKAVSLA